VSFSYHITGTETDGHSLAAASSVHIVQVQQQGAIDYNPYSILQFRLSGEYYFTRRKGNDDLKYFFAGFSAKYGIKKWNTDVQLVATNFLNVKTYNAVYLSANMFTASSYTLPGGMVLVKVMFNL